MQHLLPLQNGCAILWGHGHDIIQYTIIKGSMSIFEKWPFFLLYIIEPRILCVYPVVKNDHRLCMVHNLCMCFDISSLKHSQMNGLKAFRSNDNWHMLSTAREKHLSHLCLYNYHFETVESEFVKPCNRRKVCVSCYFIHD